MSAFPPFTHNGGPIIIEMHPDDRMYYIPLHIEDFLRGVRGLKPEEAGVYTIILTLIYEHMGRLEDNDSFICGHLNMKERYYRRIRQVLIDADKIFEADGYLYNNRAMAEISKFCATTRKKREAAREREAKKRVDREAGAPAPTPAIVPEACLSGASQARQGHVSGAPAAPQAYLTGNEKAKKLNDYNGGQATAVVQPAQSGATPQAEQRGEIEIERKSQQQQTPTPPPRSRAEMAAAAARLMDRLVEVAGVALKDPAGSAGLLDMSTIASWMEAGADPDLDIVPAVRAVSERNKARGAQRIGGWAYFNTAVAEAKARREQGLPVVEVRPVPASQNRGPRIDSRGWVRGA